MSLLDLLDNYPITYSDDTIQLEKTRQFVVEHPDDCFERSLLVGHITGSAWVVSPDRRQVLLTHHRKLNRWLQLGGHADGNPDILAVSLQEAQEESGLDNITLLSPDIYDVDVHHIPAHSAEPAHYHYDIRFIFIANPTEPLIISNESKDLAWVDVANIKRLGVDRAILRMVDKMGTGLVNSLGLGF